MPEVREADGRIECAVVSALNTLTRLPSGSAVPRPTNAAIGAVGVVTASRGFGRQW